MKTIFKHTVSALLLIIFSLLVVSCSKTNNLDLATYFKPSVNYKLYKTKDSNVADINDFISDTPILNSYTIIQFTSNKNWTYGLNLETVAFDITLSEAANMDIDITISNLENGENYNKTENTYFYHKTLSINQINTNVKLEINDIIINKECVISLEVVDSCYDSNPNLKFALTNLQITGQHKESAY